MYQAAVNLHSPASRTVLSRGVVAPLKSRVKRVTEERDILKKDAAYFASQSD